MPENTDTGLAIIEGSSAVALSGGFTLTPTGCVIEGEPTLEEYGGALERCGRLANATHWALGDLIVYGEGRGDWGESYSQYIDLTSRSFQTISQAVRVSKAFPPGASRECADRISWSHHREVLRAPDDSRMRLLREACAYDWSRDELRVAVTDLLASLAPVVIEIPPAIAVAAGFTPEGEPITESTPTVVTSDVQVKVTCRDQDAKAALLLWCSDFPEIYTTLDLGDGPDI